MLWAIFNPGAGYHAEKIRVAENEIKDIFPAKIKYVIRKPALAASVKKRQTIKNTGTIK